MDVKNIQTFICVAELGSITKAADHLGYVQSAVTMQIQQLERELGYPLFDRIGKRIYLTQLGNEFLGYAYNIIHSIQEASNLDKNTYETNGILRVGVLESLLFSKMMSLLPEFKSLYKNVEVKLKMGQTAELIQLLKENQLDMIYISSGLNTDPDLSCYYKRKEELIFICSPTHEISKFKKISASQLFDNDFIVTEHTGVCYGKLRELAEKNNSKLRTSIEVDSTIAIKNLLHTNMSLAFLPEYSAKEELTNGTLSKLDVNIEPQIYYSQIIVHKSRWLSPFMKGLIEIVKREEV